jgi:hypothetical protein
MGQTKFPYLVSAQSRIKQAAWMLKPFGKSPHPWSFCRSGILGVFLGLIALPGAEVAAQDEITPFKMTGLNGVLSFRYAFDERSDTSASGGSSGDSTRWQQSFNIRTRSYVYHPALLEMFLSAGSTFSQYSYDSNPYNKDRLLTYSATLNFLRLKAYPFTVFFSQSNPEVATGLTGRFDTVQNKFGIQGRLKKPLLPVNVNWRATRDETKGSGFDALIDNSVDRANLNTALRYKRSQDISLDLNWLQQESRSGSPGLPISETLIETISSRVFAKNVFGNEKQIRLNQNLDHRQEERAGAGAKKVGVENLGYSGNLSWKHSDRFSTQGNYSISDTERGTTWSRGQRLRVGTSLRFGQGLTLNGSGTLSSDKSPDILRDAKSLIFAAGYGFSLPFGRLSMSASLGASHTDQDSAADTAEVFEESATLNGLVPVALQEEFVVTSSVSVTNVDRTQVFIEDTDYRLVTIGDTTTLERLVTGNIFDGQEVLVSYDFRTGGTVEYGSRSQSIAANLSFSTRGSLFFNLANSSNDVLSGTPTTSLNDRTRLDLGGKIDYPFTGGWSVGGEVRYTKEDQDISPYVRTSLDAYVQLPRYWRTSVRLGMNSEMIEYDLSRDDRDNVNFRLNINSRLPGGVLLAYSGSYSENEGSGFAGESKRHNLRLDWRYRLVIFSLNAVKSDVGQGENRREDTRVFATLSRYF